MKFVHIEDFFHPSAGYQLNLLSRIQARLGHEVCIVTSELQKIPDFLTSFFGKEDIEEKDKNFFQETGVRIIRVPLIAYYSGRSIYSFKLFKIVDDLKPDLVFIHGNDTLMGIQYILKSSNLPYPLVLDNHMLEMASKNRFSKLFKAFYKKFITPIILKNEIPLIRVVDSDYVEKFLGVPLERTELSSFGTDTTYFKPDPEAAIKFRDDHALKEDDFLVLYAGKLDEIKGGMFLAEAILDELKTSSGKRIVFVIVGNTTGEYGQRVEEVFARSGNKIIRFPTQTYVALADFYRAANVAIFPRQCSLSFFEVQSCGLPALFEENEINNQRAKFGNAVTFAPGNKNDFRSKLVGYADMDNSTYESMRENSRSYILKNFDYLLVAKKFTDIMEKEVCKFKGRNDK